MKKVIITGVAGMDGSLLAEKHLAKGDKVIGIDRWKADGQYINLQGMMDHKNFTLLTGDITDKYFIECLIKNNKPTYFYNMGAVSMVPESFRIPTVVFDTNTIAVLNMLEAIRHHSPATKFLQASSSEQIGSNKTLPQNTESNMSPTSPYAVSKLASYHLVRVYREAFGMFTINSLAWNHEGEKRGPDFVTRKISIAVANIKHGKQQSLTLGNMNSYRDWGYASDYTDAMMMMMYAKQPDDYPLATGETHSIREFVEEAFKHIGLNLIWKGEGINEKGYDQEGVVRVKISKKFYRPTEVYLLHGDYTKTAKLINWEPKVRFKGLVKMMVEHDLKRLENGTAS